MAYENAHIKMCSNYLNTYEERKYNIDLERMGIMYQDITIQPSCKIQHIKIKQVL